MGEIKGVFDALDPAVRAVAMDAFTRWQRPPQVVVLGAEGTGKSVLCERLRGAFPDVDFVESAAYRPGGDSASTAPLLAQVAAEFADADAALWVLGEVATPEDCAVAAVERPIPVLGVLARADLARAPGCSSPQQAARHRGETLARRLTIGVVPVCAVLARDSVGAGQLTAADVDEVRRRAVEDDMVRWYSPDLFVQSAAPGREEQSRHLVGRLGLFGVRLLVEALRVNEDRTAEELGELMTKASGMLAVNRWVRQSLWQAASRRAADVNVALEGAVASDFARDSIEQMLKLPGLLASPWAPAVQSVGRALELAGGERLNAVRAVTLREKHAALARYRYFLAVAERIVDVDERVVAA